MLGVLGSGYLAPAMATPTELTSTDLVGEFKRQILEAAIDSGVSIASLAYIDESGKLSSNTLFSSKAKIRGVQIATYLDAIGPGIKSNIDKTVIDSESWCEVLKESGLERQGLLALEISAEPGGESISSAILSELIGRLEASVDEQAAVAGFRFGGTKVNRSPKHRHSSNYLSFMLGNLDSPPSSDFLVKAQLRLVNGKNILNTVFFNHPGASAFVNGLPSRAAKKFDLFISIQASQPSSRTVFASAARSLPVLVSRDLTYGDLRVEDFEATFTEILGEVIQDLHRETRCIPKTFSVARENGDKFKVDAGSSRGVNVGDWLIVADRRLLVDNLVSDITVDSLFVLEVVEAKNSSATAVPIGDSIAAKVPRDFVYVGLSIDEGLLR